MPTIKHAVDDIVCRELFGEAMPLNICSSNVTQVRPAISQRLRCLKEDVVALQEIYHLSLASSNPPTQLKMAQAGYHLYGGEGFPPRKAAPMVV